MGLEYIGLLLTNMGLLGMFVLLSHLQSQERQRWERERQSLTHAAMTAHGVAYIAPRPEPKREQPEKTPEYWWDPEGLVDPVPKD